MIGTLKVTNRLWKLGPKDAMKYGIPGLHKRDAGWSLALPSQIVVTLIYVGLVVLFLLLIPVYWGVERTPSSWAPVQTSMWLTDQGGAAQIRWAFCTVGSLLIVNLWIRGRTAAVRERPAVLIGHVGAAGLVLLLQWAIVVALRAVPQYTLTQVFP